MHKAHAQQKDHPSTPESQNKYKQYQYKQTALFTIPSIASHETNNILHHEIFYQSNSELKSEH